MSVAHEVRLAPPTSPPADDAAPAREAPAAAVPPGTATWCEAVSAGAAPELDGWAVQAIPGGVFLGPVGAEVSPAALRLAVDPAWPALAAEAAAPNPAVLAAVGAAVGALPQGAHRRVRLAVSFVDGIAAQQLADRHGVELVATPGRVDVTRDGMAVAGGFDPDAPEQRWEWWHYRPGLPPQPVGALLPSPRWEAGLRGLDVPAPVGVVVRRVPAGWAVLPADVVDAEFLAFADAVRPDAGMATLVVRAAGADAAMWRATEELVAAALPALGDRLRLVQPHTARTEALGRLVRRFGVEVVACDAIPWLHREDGSLLAAEGPRLGRWWRVRPEGEPEECGAIHPAPPWQQPLQAAFGSLTPPAGLTLDRVPAGLRLGPDPAAPAWQAAADRAPDPALAALVVVGEVPDADRDAVLAALPAEVGAVAVVALGPDGASEVSVQPVEQRLHQADQQAHQADQQAHQSGAADPPAVRTFDSSARGLAARVALSSAGPDSASGAEPGGAPSAADGGDPVRADGTPPQRRPGGASDLPEATPPPRPAAEAAIPRDRPDRSSVPGPEPAEGAAPAGIAAGPPAADVTAAPAQGPDMAMAAPPEPEAAAEPPAPVATATGAALPGHSVVPIVGAAHRSSAEERLACRARLAGRHDVHVVAVARVLAARPALRGPSTGEPDDAVAHDLAALRAYLAGDVDGDLDEALRAGGAAVDRAVLGCVVSGLRRMPVHRGPVFAVAPAAAVPADGYRAGEVVVEPGLLRARVRPPAGRAVPGPAVVFAVWSQRGRRVGMLAGGADDVLFAPAARFTVRQVDRDADGGGTVFLTEEGTGSADVLERLRAALDGPGADDGGALLSVGPGLHADGTPFRP